MVQNTVSKKFRLIRTNIQLWTLSGHMNSDFQYKETAQSNGVGLCFNDYVDKLTYLGEADTFYDLMSHGY